MKRAKMQDIYRLQGQLDTTQKECDKMKAALLRTACFDCMVRGYALSSDSHPSVDACLQAEVLNGLDKEAIAKHTDGKTK